MKVYIVCVTDHKNICALRAYASKQKAIKVALQCYADNIAYGMAIGKQASGNLIDMAADLADGLDYFDEGLNYTYVIREDAIKTENN